MYSKVAARTAAFVSIVFVCLVAHSAAGAPPIEAFYAKPALGAALLSPSGDRIALLRADASDAQRIDVISLASGALEASVQIDQVRTEHEQSRLADVAWAGEGHIVFSVEASVAMRRLAPTIYVVQRFPWGNRRTTIGRSGVIDLARGESRTFMVEGDAALGLQLDNVHATSTNDAALVRFLSYDGYLDDLRVAVYGYDLQRQRSERRVRGGVRTEQFVLDERGEVIARADVDEVGDHYRVFAYHGGGERADAPLMDVPLESEWTPTVVGRLNGREVALLGDIAGTGRYVLGALALDTGTRREVLALPEADVLGTVVEPWTREVVGVTYVDDTLRQRFVDPELEQRYAELRALRANSTVLLTSWNLARTRFVAYVEAPMDAGGYHLYDTTNGTLRLIGKRFSGIDAIAAGDRRAITFSARDGTRVTGYLTLPASAADAPHPLVVLVRDAVRERAGTEFDRNASFLASRGYAVLQVNARGAFGFGRAWAEASRSGWAGVLQYDLEDGVVAMERAGVAKPGGACAMGARYGGFAALLAATNPERFRCSVAIAPISDAGAFLDDIKAIAKPWSRTVEHWEREFGVHGIAAEDAAAHSAERSRRLATMSMRGAGDRMRVPLLLVHGDGDDVVRVHHSRRLRDDLVAAGHAPTYVEIERGTHGFEHLSSRVEVMRAVESFLARHFERSE